MRKAILYLVLVQRMRELLASLLELQLERIGLEDDRVPLILEGGQQRRD